MLSRRKFLIGASSAAVAVGTGVQAAQEQPEFVLRALWVDLPTHVKKYPDAARIVGMLDTLAEEEFAGMTEQLDLRLGVNSFRKLGMRWVRCDHEMFESLGSIKPNAIA